MRLRSYLTSVLIVAMLLGFAMPAAASPSGTSLPSDDDSRFTVVIDAGHGGKDGGALGTDVKEKDVNLGVALKLGQMLEKLMSDVKVVYTRKTDKFISLQERADIANHAKGDFFVSLHCNSAPENSKRRLTVNGTSVYVLGRKSEENLAVAKRENAVIMLEDNYATTYQGFDPESPESYIAFELIQNQHFENSLLAAQSIQNELVTTAGRHDNGVRQAMFWVLVQTGMPAVLIELDFICNPTQGRYMKSEAGQARLAEAIFNGIATYKSNLERATAAEARAARPAGKKAGGDREQARQTSGSRTEKKSENAGAKKDAIIYKVQFMTSPKRLKPGSKEFKGLDNVESYREGSTYKYTTGQFTDKDEAQAEARRVRRFFKDAFVIATRNGKRIK